MQLRETNETELMRHSVSLLQTDCYVLCLHDAEAQTKMIDAFTAKITTEFVLNTNIEERAESLINGDNH